MDAPPEERLARRLEEVTRTLAGTGDELVILYSGGIDSSILAWALRDRANTQLVTIGLPGTTDLRAARRGADLIQLPWTGIELSSQQLTEAWARWAPFLLRRPEPSRSVQFSLAIAFGQTPPGRLLLGQGADELFWGYARFERLDVATATAEAASALHSLLEEELPLTRRLAGELGRVLVLPYLEPGWLEAVLRVPPHFHLPSRSRKPVLRQIAARLGLPASLVETPKKAIQYGSGISAALRSIIGASDPGSVRAKRAFPPLREAPSRSTENP